MQQEAARQYQLAEFTLDPGQRSLSRDGVPIRLANRPYEVLLYLIKHRDRLVSRAELLEQFWGGKDVYDDSVRKAVGAVRKALGDQQAEPRFIETRYGGRYRYIGPVEELSSAPIVELERTRAVKIVVEEEFSAPARAGLPAAQPALKTRFALATTLSLLVLAGLVLGFYNRPGRAGKGAPVLPPQRSIAVLPLKNDTGDAAQDYLSDGLSESLINELGKLRDLKVIGRTSAFSFKDKAVDVREVGERLGVAHVLEGSLRKEGETVRVAVRLLSTADGRVLWTANSYTRPLKEILKVQDEIGCSVAENLRVLLCGEPMHRVGTAKLDAYEAYLKGVYWRRKSEVKKAIEYFEQAVRLDANYALAWAGLADAWTIMELHSIVPPRTAAPKAKEFAARALALDDSLAAPYAALGLLASFSERNWVEGQRYFQQALGRNPNHAFTHAWYSSCLLAQGRFAEAEAALLRAQELDPLADGIVHSLVETYYYWRRPDRCLTQAAKLLALAPGHGGVYRNQVRCYLLEGRTTEALRAAQQLGAPEQQIWEAATLAYAGQTAAARQLIEQLAGSERSQRDPYGIGCLYARLGDSEQAFVWLRRAAEQQQADLVSLKIDPALDALRGDPRFTELLRRCGLD